MKTKDQFWQENYSYDSYEVFSKTWDYFNKPEIWLKPAVIYRETFVPDAPQGSAASFTNPGHFEYELRYKDSGCFKFIMLRQSFKAYKIDEDVLICNCLNLTKQLLATNQFSEHPYFYPEQELSVLQFRN